MARMNGQRHDLAPAARTGRHHFGLPAKKVTRRVPAAGWADINAADHQVDRVGKGPRLSLLYILLDGLGSASRSQLLRPRSSCRASAAGWGRQCQ